jgi:hypothetical protein
MDFDHSASCSTTLNEEVSATGFPLGALGVAARFGVERSQWQNNARFLPEPRLLLIFSPHLLQTLSTGMSYFIFDIPILYVKNSCSLNAPSERNLANSTSCSAILGAEAQLGG